MKITNRTKNTVVAEKADVAETFLSRLTGLLSKKNLEPNRGLVIRRCNSIHMFFMRFAIDAVFVDDRARVVGLVQNLQPFRISPVFFKAQDVIELPCGTVRLSRTEIGDQLELSA